MVCGPLPQDALDVIEIVAQANSSPFYRWDRDFSMVHRDGTEFDYHGTCWDLDRVDLGDRFNPEQIIAIAVDQPLQEG